jgi:hypothetical protein
VFRLQLSSLNKSLPKVSFTITSGCASAQYIGVLNLFDMAIGLVGSIDLPNRAIYDSASCQADQTTKNVKQSNCPKKHQAVSKPPAISLVNRACAVARAAHGCLEIDMKFALVEGIRQEATAGARGLCPGCSSSVIPKCGEIRLRHWAHLSTMVCDPWREPETEWHRGWKDEFPKEWQEVWHRASSGEIHI